MPVFNRNRHSGSSGTPWGTTFDQSALFDGVDDNLTRTPTAGNRQIWTFATWIKRHTLSAVQGILSARDVSANWFELRFAADDTIQIYFENATDGNLFTTAKFRGPVAHMHICLAVDTTQATAADRVKLYINGVEAALTGTYPSQNLQAGVNEAIPHYIGQIATATSYLGATLSDVIFIDGTQHVGTDFVDNPGSTATAKSFTVPTAGNNYYLDFSNVANFGEDASANGNDWTVTNAPTASSDVPTDHEDGSKGNLAVLNSEGKNSTNDATLSNGNKTIVGNGSNPTQGYLSTIAAGPTGKYYVEIDVNGSTGDNAYIGVCNSDYPIDNNILTNTGGNHYAGTNGNTRINGSAGVTSSEGAWTNGDVIGIAYDADNQKVWFHEDGVYATGTPVTPTGGETTSGWDIGQTHFFLAVFATTNNLTIVDPANWAHKPTDDYLPWGTASAPKSDAILNDHMTVSLRAGDSSASTAVDVNAFDGNKWDKQIDLLISKPRNNAGSWLLQSTILGSPVNIYFDSSSKDTTSYVTALGTGEFTIGTNVGYNSNTWTYADYAFNLPTDETVATGDISVDWKVNADLGMAIGFYTAPASPTAGNTIDLPSAVTSVPHLVGIIRTDTTGEWLCRTDDFTGLQYVGFHSTNAISSSSAVWNSTAHDATSITLGTYAGVQAANGTYFVIIFWETDLCKKIAYEGNASTDGPLWYGEGLFEFGLFKNADSAGKPWNLYDTARDPINVMDAQLQVSSSAAEATLTFADAITTGFKVRGSDTALNTTGTHVGVAFINPPPAGAGQLRG